MAELLLDLGNTRLKWAWRDAQAAGPVQSLAHADADFAGRWQRVCATLPTGTRAWLASVAPGPQATVQQGLRVVGVDIRIVRTQAECAGLRIAYAEPATLGVDRFLGLLAAHSLGRAPCLLVSVGSALTVDLLDAEGRHHGGLIALSPTQQREALAARFPQLPAGGGEAVEFAAGTADALTSGARAAALGLIERAWRRARQRLGAEPRLLLTGGGAAELRAGLELPHDYAEALVLDGLAVYARCHSGGGGWRAD
jgi:type III pantothenate kinase